MIKLEKIPEDIHTHLPALKELLDKDNSIIFACLFGGLASGSQKPLSDIDIAVYCRTLTDRAEYKLDLFCQISECLGTCEIDLILLNYSPVTLAGRIFRNCQILSDKEPFVRHSYQSRIMREFFDFSRKEQQILFGRYAIG